MGQKVGSNIRDVERREGIANCTTDRKLAKMMTTLTAAFATIHF